MFDSQLGLRENPFVAGHNPRFVYPSRAHQDALARLRYGIRNREPFVLITGEAGTGKTTAVYDALAEWGSRTVVALISHSPLTPDELLEQISLRFGVAAADSLTEPAALAQLERLLGAARARGELAILLLDEAQNLNRELLEGLGALADLEAQGERLVQTVLVARPELETRLEEPELRDLRERIGIHCRIHPLGMAETARYIHHRVAAAGGNGPELFPHPTCLEIHRITNGIPREINIVAGQALLIACARDPRTVTPEHVREVEREIGADSAPRSSSEGCLATAAVAMAAHASLVSSAAWQAPDAPDMTAGGEREAPADRVTGETAGPPETRTPRPPSTAAPTPPILDPPVRQEPAPSGYDEPLPATAGSTPDAPTPSPPAPRTPPKASRASAAEPGQSLLPSWFDQVVAERRAREKPVARRSTAPAAAPTTTPLTHGPTGEQPWPPAGADAGPGLREAAAIEAAIGAPPAPLPWEQGPGYEPAPGGDAPFAGGREPLSERGRRASLRWLGFGVLLTVLVTATATIGAMLLVRAGPWPIPAKAPPIVDGRTHADEPPREQSALAEDEARQQATRIATTPEQPAGTPAASPALPEPEPPGAAAGRTETSMPITPGTTEVSPPAAALDTGMVRPAREGAGMAGAAPEGASEATKTTSAAKATEPTPVARQTGTPQVYFGVQVGTYLNEGHARLERTRLEEGARLPTRIVTVTDANVPLHRVVVGVFPDRRAAQSTARDLIGSGLVSDARVVALPQPGQGPR